ncbi:hypothetical protein [Streptococcus pneumoniae]|uniref:hypothetical protein n=1 Tax=Streptococcus pneumoniae TaxID=1313 RepID=UPI001E2E28DA|nr:hypothetical protein [Streptococcus pneumoniae]
MILVHNKQLLDQWLDRLNCFLTFEEEEAIRYTASGREKVIGYVGQYGGTKKWLSKLLFDFRRGGGYPLYGIRS